MLNPYANLDGTTKMTTERQVFSDTLLLFVGVESDSFVRDPDTLRVHFKIRNSGHISQAKMSHISPGLMNQVF